MSWHKEKMAKPPNEDMTRHIVMYPYYVLIVQTAYMKKWKPGQAILETMSHDDYMHCMSAKQCFRHSKQLIGCQSTTEEMKDKQPQPFNRPIIKVPLALHYKPFKCRILHLSSSMQNKLIAHGHN